MTNRLWLAIPVLALALGTPRIAQAGAQVPFRMTIAVSDTFYTAGCPSVCFTETGSGTGTHLGAVTLAGNAIATSVTFPDATHLQVATIETETYTGANGDTITLAVSSEGTEDLTTGAATITGSYTVTGGTGRFAGAGGGGSIIGTTQTNAAGTGFTGTFTLTGSISSVGSIG